MKAKFQIAVLAGVLVASVPALAVDLSPFTGSFVPPGTPPYTVLDSGFGTATVTADGVYGKGAGYSAQDGDNAYLLVRSNGIGQPPALRTTEVRFVANTTNYRYVQVSGWWMPALDTSLPGDLEYFFESNDCVTIELQHNGTGASPVTLVNNVCGAALNAGNGSWSQFASSVGAIPNDATTVSLVVFLTSSAVNESLGLDNLRISAAPTHQAPALTSVAFGLLALGLLAIGRKRLSHS